MNVQTNFTIVMNIVVFITGLALGFLDLISEEINDTSEYNSYGIYCLEVVIFLASAIGLSYYASQIPVILVEDSLAKISEILTLASIVSFIFGGYIGRKMGHNIVNGESPITELRNSFKRFFRRSKKFMNNRIGEFKSAYSIIFE